MTTEEPFNPLSRIPNPFRGNIYTNAWRESQADVAAINAQAFDTLWQRFEEVRATEGTASLLIHGAPGTGKTHLLGRLRRRLAAAANDAPDGAVAAVFTHIQLAANPDTVWRQLRRRITDDLMHEVEGLTQLQRIVAHEFAHTLESEPAVVVRNLDKLARMKPDLLRRAIDHMCGRLDIHHETAIVIEHLVQRRMLRDARAWLRGDYVAPERRQALGVNPDPDVDSEETEAREVVIGLCSISPRSLPLILCFDQIEAIERVPDDDVALFAYGRVLADLYSEGRNLLLISCIQSSFMGRLGRAVGGADWDRLAERVSELPTLSTGDAEALVCARMERIPALAELRGQRPNLPLWPLTQAQIGDDSDAFSAWTPRRLLASAARWFEEAASRQLEPPEDQETFLAREFDQRADAADLSGAQDILLHGLPIICGLSLIDWSVDPAPQAILGPAVSLRLKNPRGDAIDVAVLNEPSRSVWRPLRKLLQRPQRTRLAIVREAGLEISPTAVKTHQMLEQLQEQGAGLVWVGAEALAALDAARSLIADARTGDLATKEGDTLAADTVAEWLEAHFSGQLAPVADVMANLVGGGGQLNGELESIKEIVNERCVVDLASVATQLRLDEAHVERLCRTAGNAFGLLDGPPLVLFALRNRRRQPVGEQQEQPE